MNRGKELVIIAHCMLNCNSKVEGTATYTGAQKEIIKYLIAEGYGIIQLPCPEITLYGIKRWGHVKEQFDTPYFKKHCKNIFISIKEQMMDYIKNGYDIKAIIGINGSPSCGVDYTCSSVKWGGEIGNEFNIQEKTNQVERVNGMGVFMEEISNQLQKQEINIKFIGINEEDINGSLLKLKESI